MVNIHRNCYETAEEFPCSGNLCNGAPNICGFIKIANAMVAPALIYSKR